jgi:hypothetical protein
MTHDRRNAGMRGTAAHPSRTAGTDEALDELTPGPIGGDPAMLRGWLGRADLAGRVDLMSRLGVVGNAGAAALLNRPVPAVQRDDDGDALGGQAALTQSQEAGPANVEGIELSAVSGASDPIGLIFAKVVASNIASASAISVPARYLTLLGAYAAANPADGAILTGGSGRSPTYYSGGWILDIQTAAKAMTLDSSVFVRGELDLRTYIHEMVHVNQYGKLGPSLFLASYFGLSAAEIALRLVMHRPLDPMTASPQEQEAYAIDDRFMTWWRAHPEAEPASP